MGDGLLNKIEDAQAFVQDTIDDWFKASAARLSTLVATGVFIGALL